MGNPALQMAPTVPGKIHRAGFGWINVGGKFYEQDRVVHRHGVSAAWWRSRRHYFELEDAMAIVDIHRPEVFILGIGWMGMMRVDVDTVRDQLSRINIRFIAERTPEAILAYQRTSADGRDCVAALHVTC